MKFIDLSHRIENGMVTFPGYPGTNIDVFYDYEESAKKFGEPGSCWIDRIQMVSITGTYLDAPRHIYPEGHMIADYKLEQVANLPFDVAVLREGENCFDVEDVEGLGIKGGAVLFCTDHSSKFNTSEYGNKPPYVKPEVAEYLLKKGVVFFGIDSPLIDSAEHCNEWGCPVHRAVLASGGVICEDMTNLRSAIPAAHRGRLFAVPPAADMASFTTRAFVMVDESAL